MIFEIGTKRSKDQKNTMDWINGKTLVQQVWL